MKGSSVPNRDQGELSQDVRDGENILVTHESAWLSLIDHLRVDLVNPFCSGKNDWIGTPMLSEKLF